MNTINPEDITENITTNKNTKVSDKKDSFNLVNIYFLFSKFILIFMFITFVNWMISCDRIFYATIIIVLFLSV